MAALHLLPSNATALERATSEAADLLPELAPGADAVRAFKFRAPNESILPWLVVEYGLGQITPFLPDLATVIEYGLRWNKVKGTPQGVREAMSWVGYAFDELYELPTRRTRWHLFELDLDRFWDVESDLDKIEQVVRLSQPVRSDFWRGYDRYNVREHEWSYTTWGNSIWGDCSGARLHDGGVKWSFGRTFEPPSSGVHNFTQAELTALGVWIDPGEGGSLGWGAFPWSTPNVKWSDEAAAVRAGIIALGILSQSCWVGIYRADGQPIGYRKARAFHSVSPSLGGYYTVAGNPYIVAPTAGARIYAEAMTDFGEGDGQVAASWNFIIGGEVPAGAPPGTQWLPGAMLDGGFPIGSFPMASAKFGKTSREQFRAILHIP